MATTDPVKLNTVPQRVEIEAYHGDTLTLTLTISDEAGTPVDITDGDFDMMIRRMDGTLVQSLAIGTGITITDSANGEFEVEIDANSSGDMPADVNMRYDIQWTQDTTVTTVVVGNITMKSQITI